jgi:uncharacterized protein YfaS (alpha-2-macroglobulin family)
VVFTQEQDTSRPVPKDCFRLIPRVPGKAAWQDALTLVFTPDEPLAPGKRYRAVVDGTSLGDGIGVFGFEFETQSPVVQVELDPVRLDENGYALVGGTARLEPGVPHDRIERIIRSGELGKPQWTHEQGIHRFVFPPVKQEEGARTVAVSWSGRPAGIRDQGFTTVLIPGYETFEAVRVSRPSRGFLEVLFSAPLKPEQDLRGFISLSGDTNIRYSVQGNVVRIFGSQEHEGITPGSRLLIQDLEDIRGKGLANPASYTVPEHWELPEVRFTGKGAVLPTTQGAAMAIETRNLSGVLVEAFQIYGNSMIQFLQVNNLSGVQELDRVGEPVWSRAFDFYPEPSPEALRGDINRWVRRGLDLSDLAQKYPDGMFHIRLSFRPRHVVYQCGAGHEDFSQLAFPDDSFPRFDRREGESSFWDTYENKWSYTWSQYLNDPCHPAFYIPTGDHTITVGRNVLVSDLGLMAKRSIDGSWLVAASNIRTAEPAAQGEIRVLNYQGRVLASLRTGPDGMAVIPNLEGGSGGSPAGTPGIPAFLYAESPLGRAYLKLNESLAMAVSHFDVAGGAPLQGIRGLLYGERGVWRPGDPIYLTFLLSDPGGTMGPDHPITFELEDPRGGVTGRQTLAAPVDGFYAIKTAVAPDALTGNWTARVRVGGKVFHKPLKIETVIPNRLKLNLDFGSSPYLDSAETPVFLEAAWLYGAPASGLKADVSVSLGDQETAFPGFGDYVFRDPSRSVRGERQELYQGGLDGEGKAAFTMELNPGDAAPGKLTARFMTRAFEPSGAASVEQISREYSPYSRYVGIKLPRGDASRNMLLTDTEHQADIVLLDRDGKPVAGKVAVNCAVYKLSWRWWWEKGAGEAAEFASALSRNPVMRETLTVSDGKGGWKFQARYPDWGRYLIVAQDASGGHSAAAIAYIDWPGWAGRAQEGGPDASAMLALTAGKPGYKTGERASVSFPSNKEAAALVVLEQGGRVLRREWVSCQDTATRYEFLVEASMAPNLYAHVTLLQPHLQTRNDLPLRLYGIVPVMVDDPITRLTPQIDAPERWQSESTASFTVSEGNGRAMAYTVAVVDEGLLGLTRYTLPNPHDTFYAREASFLKSWDLYSDIMGAYAGNLETLLAIGGGDEGLLDGGKTPERFKPVVRFFGPYELKAGEKRREVFELPPYAGSLRIMVLGASSTKGPPAPYSYGRAYGAAERTVRVSSDIMIFPTLPRTFSPGDEAVVPVTVVSYTPVKRKVRLSMAVEGGRLLEPEIRELDFDKPGEQTVRYRVRAPDLAGSMGFAIRAESPGVKTAAHTAEREVRSTALPVIVGSFRLLEPGASWTGTLQFPGVPGSNRGKAEFSRLPPLNVESRLGYLITYPHGCLEQTASAVFPQLYLHKVLALGEAERRAIRSNVAAGITRLEGFMVPGGGFSYWPGADTAHAWGSIYAGHFLLEARRAGYTVRPELLESWLRFQKAQASQWNREDAPADQAYRLYILALAGEPDLGSMNRLRETRNLDGLAAWRLAAAYWYAGQRDIARTMAEALHTQVKDYRELSGSFGSALRDKAVLLETLLLLGDGARARPLYEDLSAALSGESWLSTQETAYALIAMLPYTAQKAGTGPITVDCAFGGPAQTLRFDTPAAGLDVGSLPGSSAGFSIRNTSAVPCYAKITVQGLPEEGAESALAQGLSLSVEYRHAGRGTAVDPDALALGADMEVRVTLRNTASQSIPEIALAHPLPASWELVNYRLGGAASGGSNPSGASFTYQDIRDDRVLTYFNLNRGEQKTVSFRVTKAYEGSFFRPAIHAYAMYDESIRALEPGVRRR